jgi:hypothetical protein
VRGAGVSQGVGRERPRDARSLRVPSHHELDGDRPQPPAVARDEEGRLRRVAEKPRPALPQVEIQRRGRARGDGKQPEDKDVLRGTIDIACLT